ncbi:MAG: cell wall-binding repeat-containing protein [Peptococcaceae bacterium]|nr:cell wall-binding repeat-containing protein [Peptococcaceae bacterium]
MKIKSKTILSIACAVCLLFSFTAVAQADPYNDHAKNKHLFGNDRYETSISIAQEQNNNQKVDNIVIASANNFADALAASTLAAKLHASIVLVGKEYNDTKTSYRFIENQLNKGGTVTIIGGPNVISKSVENKLLRDGYIVTRYGGDDRFATDNLIVKNLNVPVGTPIIITNGYNFPDALGVASLAASKGWPILLSAHNQLPQSVQDFIASDKPTDVYIVGGKGVLQNNIEGQILSKAPEAKITRLGGEDRFETLSLILNKFYPNPSKLYIANGLDFADALSGSTLAAAGNSPIILVNPKSNALPVGIQNYLITLRNNGVHPEVTALGGEFSVPQRLLDKINTILLNDQNTSNNVAVTGVTLNQSTLTLTVGGATGTLTATVAPDNASNKNVTWSSSDTTIATVANGVVTPVAAGTATITVTTEDGSKTATCTVTINN